MHQTSSTPQGFWSTGQPSLNALKDFTDLTPQIQQHLTKVYSTLAFTVLSAACGAYCHLLFNLGGTLSMMVCFGLLFAIHAAQSPATKYGLLLAFGFADGLSLGPLISQVIHINDSLILTAFATTTVVFASFSASALWARRRSFLYLGGILGSAISMLLVMGLMNMFIQNAAMAMAQIYVGLIVFSGFIVYDTQVIVERAGLGRMDHVEDALRLFLDFVGIFVRLLIILARNSSKKKKENR